MADFVADVRAPTPSAAAETALPDRAEVWRWVDGLALALNASAAGQAGQSRAGVERSLQRLRSALPDAAQSRHSLGALVLAAEVAMERLTSRHGERLGSFAAQLRSPHPRPPLARRYAVVQMREGPSTRSTS